jgi:hypothetical protein
VGGGIHFFVLYLVIENEGTVRGLNWLWLSFPGFLGVPLGISAHRGSQACVCCDLGIVSSFTPYFVLERGGRVGLVLAGRYFVMWG